MHGKIVLTDYCFTESNNFQINDERCPLFLMKTKFYSKAFCCCLTSSLLFQRHEQQFEASLYINIYNKINDWFEQFKTEICWKHLADYKEALYF